MSLEQINCSIAFRNFVGVDILRYLRSEGDQTLQANSSGGVAQLPGLARQTALD